MKPLNTEATNMLVRFIDRLQGATTVTLPLNGNFPIRITKGSMVKTTQGEGDLFSIGRMYDPKKPAFQPLLKLIVIDERGTKGDKAKVSAFPTFFSDDLNGIIEESCIVRSGAVQHCIPRIQAIHAQFIDRWLRKMIDAGYLA